MKMPDETRPEAPGPMATREVPARVRAHLTAALVALKTAKKSLQTATRGLPEGAELKGVDPRVVTTFGAVARLLKPQPACSEAGCGRKIRARGLCQTHYKQWRTTGTLLPILRTQPKRAETARLGALSVSRECAEKVTRDARERGLALNAVVTDVLEAWGRRYWARRRAGRSKP